MSNGKYVMLVVSTDSQAVVDRFNEILDEAAGCGLRRAGENPMEERSGSRSLFLGKKGKEGARGLFEPELFDALSAADDPALFRGAAADFGTCCCFLRA